MGSKEVHGEVDAMWPTLLAAPPGPVMQPTLHPHLAFNEG